MAQEKAIKNGNSAVFMQPGNDGGVWDSGMSKREYFAALAMQGLLSHSGFGETHADIAQNACMLADALLLELEKPV